jgi:hypothetical protein
VFISVHLWLNNFFTNFQLSLPATASGALLPQNAAAA